MTVFSVAITRASSRKICAPRSRSALHLVALGDLDRRRRAARTRGCAGRAGGGRSRRRRAAARSRGPSRASSGPASRNEARIRSASASSTSCEVMLRGVRRAPRSAPSTRPRRRCSCSSSTIVSTSRIRGTFESVTGSSVSRHAARIGSAPFLFPAARMRPPSGWPPSITNDSRPLAADDGADGQAPARLGHSARRGTDPRAGLGDADALHEERGAAAARARGRGVDRVLRAEASARTRSSGA